MGFGMKDTHPLKRKSIKPSSSTVRGMLPGPQFRALDAAMQSLRAAGMRLDWRWKNKDIGWVCVGLLDDTVACELRPTQEPLVGVVELSKDQQGSALADKKLPEKFRRILRVPLDETKKGCLYEFELETTQQRDLLSDFMEALTPHIEASEIEDDDK
jgi:hypothetical protein